MLVEPFRMKNPFSGESCSDGFLNGGEVFVENAYLVYDQLGIKGIGLFVKTDAKNSALAVPASATTVMHILGSCDVPKITQSIVVPVTIDVVNFANRLQSCAVNVATAVKNVVNLVNANFSVAIWPLLSSGGLSCYHAATSALPRKYAGAVVVIKQLTKAFCGRILLSHIGLQVTDSVRSLTAFARCGASRIIACGRVN